MLTVCEGVRDVQVDAAANVVRVLPVHGARRGPDAAELLRHLDEIGLGLTFVVVSDTTAGGADRGRTNDASAELRGASSASAGKVVLPDLEELKAARNVKEGGVMPGQAVVPTGATRAAEVGPIVLAVAGMMCQKNCGSTVRKSLGSVPGVTVVQVSFAEKRAKVWGAELSADSLVDAVEGVGFGAVAVPDVELEVEGMMCQKSCGSTVEAALAAVPGVCRAEVSFADKRARVWGAEAGADVLVDAVEAVGFGAAVSPTAVLRVEGMMCQKNCGTTVQRALQGVPGVGRADVSFADKLARVWGGAGLEGGALVDAIEAVGFDASVAPVAELEVEGMMCQNNCGTTVKNALEAVAGVTRAEVSFARGRAEVWGATGLSASALVDAVTAVGFDGIPAAVGGGAGASASPAPGANGTAQRSHPLPVVDPSPVNGRRGEFPTEARKGRAGPRVVASAAAHRDKKKAGMQTAAAAIPTSASANGYADEGGLAGGDGRQMLSTGTFSVEGMSCAACVGNVERFVAAMGGVGGVRVALLAGQVHMVPSSSWGGGGGGEGGRGFFVWEQ